MSTNETSLKIVENQGILKRIINFFKRIVSKEKTNHAYFSNNEKKDNIDSKNFLKNIKYTEDPDEKHLLEIQTKLEKMGINEENAFILTKDLSEIQKKKLLDLYDEQINSLNISINNYKKSIMRLRKNVQTDN